MLCYLFVDRPVAFYVHNHKFADDRVLKWLTYLPPVLRAWVPLVLAAFAVRRAWGPLRRWELAVVATCVSLVLTEQFRGSLAYTFGRYWPETWINGNPSLIGDGATVSTPFTLVSPTIAFPRVTPLGPWPSPPSPGSLTRDGGGPAGWRPWLWPRTCWGWIIISWET